MKKPKIEPSETPQLLRISEVAAMLGLHHKTIYHWVRMGKVEAVPSPGGMFRIRVEDARDLCHKSGLAVPAYIASIPRKVVMIEEDASAIKMAKRQIRSRGFAVATFSDPFAGFVHVVKDPPEILIVDVHCRAIDVHAMVAALKSDDRTKSIRPVAWSDVSDPGEVVKLSTTGFSGLAPRADVSALLSEITRKNL